MVVLIALNRFPFARGSRFDRVVEKQVSVRGHTRTADATPRRYTDVISRLCIVMRRDFTHIPYELHFQRSARMLCYNERIYLFFFNSPSI
jgi:hypothetical protein